MKSKNSQLLDIFRKYNTSPTSMIAWDTLKIMIGSDLKKRIYDLRKMGVQITNVKQGKKIYCYCSYIPETIKSRGKGQLSSGAFRGKKKKNITVIPAAFQGESPFTITPLKKEDLPPCIRELTWFGRFMRFLGF